MNDMNTLMSTKCLTHKGTKISNCSSVIFIYYMYIRIKPFYFKHFKGGGGLIKVEFTKGEEPNCF